jgi:hypothetical protein
MRQNIMGIATFCLFLIGLAGCAVTDVDKTVDFNRLQTYSWGESEIKVENPLYRGDLINKRIKHAVEDEFNRIGLRKDDKHPDFLVSYKTYTEKKEQQYSNNGYYPYAPFFPYRFGFYPFAYGWPYGNTRSYTYTQGTLILDITDKATNEVVWRGSVKGNIEQTSNIEKLIRKGIKAIIKKYPVREDKDDKEQGYSSIS